MRAYILNARAYWLSFLFSSALTVASCDDTGREAGSPSTKEARAATLPAVSDSTDWKEVDNVMGRSGKLQPGGVYKYSMPRTDLQVKIGQVTVKPSLALGSWLAFKRAGSASIAMGDLVLAESEIAPVMSKLQEMGIQQTALHNHLLHERPHVMYMHIHAHGEAIEIARGVRAALALTKTPPAKPEAGGPAEPLGLDTLTIAQVLRYSGNASGGVYQVNVPRADPVRAGDTEVPPAMGVATVINFQPAGGNTAAVTGDFVMTGNEVNPVIKALRTARIEVTALHNHMLDEEPRLFFAHFWGRDDASALARGLRSALDQMNVTETP